VIVVDASALLKVLLRTSAAKSVEIGSSPTSTLHAPHLLYAEVAQVSPELRRKRRNRRERRGRMALVDLADFPCSDTRTISFCRASGTYGTI